MTDEIRLLIEERKSIHRIAKQTNKPDDWLVFRQFRNYVTSREKERKIEYISELENKVSNTSNFGKKEWWKLVKLFLKKKGMDSNEIPPLTFNDRVLYTNKEKADAFNSFFISQSSLENEDGELPDIPFFDLELTEITLTTSDVKDVILNLSTNKATDC